MSEGTDQLKHIVVLMMENRSFDHMLGGLKSTHPQIDGIDQTFTNPDNTGALIPAQPKAKYLGQLDPDPDHHFKAVNKQIFNGGATPTMQGFVGSYFDQQHNVNKSHNIMYYFTPAKVPVISALATEFAVFNRWFASIPGPTLCNRAFAHYGTSFGRVAMEFKYFAKKYQSIYQRVKDEGKTSKLYYFDVASSSLEVANIFTDEGAFFGTFEQFLADCQMGQLPDYCLVEPNYTDHDGPGGGELSATDQHPDHDVAMGDNFIADVYMAIRSNPDLWKSTALLIVYDEHGGIFDHVPPPSCQPDEFTASASDTETGQPFAFDRLGVRVPAILVSPWIPKGTVSNDVFDHASIPATVTEWLELKADHRSPREDNAKTFLDVISGDVMRSDDDTPDFS